METMIRDIEEKTEPLCPVFGQCGGCLYQDYPYEAELKRKKEVLLEALSEKIEFDPGIVEPVVASPSAYHTRSRLDLTMRRTRPGEIFLGFMSVDGRKLVPVDSCYIARKEIADFIPELKAAAAAKLPPDYRNANIVVKTGDDGRLFWGGIGRKSLRMNPEDYLWTEIRGKRIYYSLETFFQANLGILPLLMDKIEELLGGRKKLFLDLYSGVGLFGISLSGLFEEVIMIEECPGSVELAKYNVSKLQMKGVEIRGGRVEEYLPEILSRNDTSGTAAMIDPPRRGLSPSALSTVAGAKKLENLFYLSCHPESLARDLAGLLPAGWKIERIVPFDFFPRTRHLETLVLLKPVK